MAILRFYKPRTIAARVHALVTGQQWSHVGVVHAVYDIMVMSESHPRKGAWCRPLSKTPFPDAELRLDDLNDQWVTAWLVKRWGMRFGACDSLLAASVSTRDTLQDQFLPSAAFVAYLLRDAIDAKWRVPMSAALRAEDPRAVTPDELWNGTLAMTA